MAPVPGCGLIAGKLQHKGLWLQGPWYKQGTVGSDW